MLVWLRRWKVGRKETEMEEEVISSKVFFIALVVLPSCHGSRAAGAVAVVYSGITVVTLIHERVVGEKMACTNEKIRQKVQTSKKIYSQDNKNHVK